MSSDPSTPQAVLTFWFTEAGEARWYASDPAFDADIRDRFGSALSAARAGDLAPWKTDVEGRLALTIVLDQFSRNIHRGEPAAFAADAAALALANRALRFGDDLWLKAHRPDPWRAFLYLPFMHSEDLADQRRCLDLHLTHGPDAPLPYARAHHDIIARFARFPHRNAILGRESTPEELVFLQHHGAGF